ncbi:MAG TPA: BON domain-containing protein [Blastocatellia bacterium]|nr:BON domain-containing protein [Blastocatellia bacterium]
MRKVSTIIIGLAMAAVLALGAFAQEAQTKPATKAVTPAKPKPARTAKAPKSDADIQSCIEQKLAAAPKLKDQGFSVTVSGGVATFTGTAKNAGSKGSVGRLAKSCGAKQTVNNITVEAPARPAVKK